MKILLISTEIWSRNNPEGIVTRKLCKGLLKYYSVDIVTTNKTDLVGINKEYIVDDNGSEFIEKLKKISIGIEKNRFTQNVIKLIKDKVIDINDYDLLITRSEPFYIHNIGVFLKRNNYPIYWIASFGDPVFCNPYNSKSYIKKNYTKKTEKEIWHYADKITHTNSCALEVYEKNNFPIEKSYILPNTYEVSENEACNNFVYQDKKIDNFCYIGSLYGNRTPERLFDFLRKYDGNYKLTLIGAVRNVYWENRFGIFNKFLMARDLKKIKKNIKNFNLEDKVELLPFMKQEHLREYIIKQATCLVNIDASLDGDNIFLSSKIVEYLYYNKPILNISTEGASTNFMKSVGVDFSYTSSVKKENYNKEFISKLIPKQNLISNYRSDIVAKKLIEAVDL